MIAKKTFIFIYSEETPQTEWAERWSEKGNI